MAFPTIADGPRGLVPARGPMTFEVFEAAETVYQFQPVKLDTSGTIVDAVQTGSVVLGVAMNYGVDGDSITVSVNPDTIYEATADVGDGVAVLDDIGLYVAFLDSNAYSGKYCAAEIDLDNAATAATNKYMKVVGLPTIVDNAAAASKLKLFVKLVSNQFENTATIA